MNWMSDFEALIRTGVRKIRFTYSDDTSRDIQFEDDVLDDWMGVKGKDLSSGEIIKPTHTATTVVGVDKK